MVNLNCVESALPIDLGKELVFLGTKAFVLDVVEVSIDSNGVGRNLIETNLERDGP